MQGTLTDTTATTVVTRLAERSATGTLTFSGPRGRATVGFVDGAITSATPPDGHGQGLRLGERLVHAGRLAPEALDRLLAEPSGGPAPLDRALVEDGLVPPDVVRVLRQEQVLHVLDQLLQWDVGEYAFTTGPPPTGRVVLPADRALVEVQRRARERRRVHELVPGPAAVPRPTGSGPGDDDLSPDARTVLAAVDGHTSVARVAAALGYGDDEALRIVYRLALQGRVTCDEAPPSPAEASLPADIDTEPRPWVGWAGDAAAAAPTPAGGAVDRQSATPALDEDVRRALFSELHAVSRADTVPPSDRPDAADTDDQPADEPAPPVEPPDEESTAGPRLPDLSGEEVSSLLRELHDLHRDDD